MTAPEDISRLPVVILAGGMGTRLREITGERVPKPLVEIGEQPILWHIMKIYGHLRLRALRALPGVQERADQGATSSATASTCPTSPSASTATTSPSSTTRWATSRGRSPASRPGSSAGTGARVRRIRDYIDTDTFLFTYGDGVGDVDIPRSSNSTASTAGSAR